MNAEKSLIGSIMIDPMIIELTTVEPSDFYDNKNSNIFSAIKKLQLSGKKIDIITVSEALGNTVISELSEAIASVPSSSHWQEYEQILKERSYRNKIRKIATTATGMINDTPPSEVADWIVKSLNESDISTIESVGIDKLCHASLTNLIEISSGEKQIGIKIGLIPDNLINGDFIVLAGRPSMGKTAAVISMILGASDPIAFFSLEMTANSITNRMIANLSGISNFSIQNGYLDQDEMAKIGLYYDQLAKKKIFICDTPRLSTQEIKSESIRLHRNHGIKAIFIDYLQIMKPERGETLYAAITRISGELKALAKYLNVPVVCLSQLSRESEKRSNKKPMLSDLRESGAIEQDADVVMLIHSDDYYENKDQMNYDSQIEIAKFRNGRVGTLQFEFQKPEQRFVPK